MISNRQWMSLCLAGLCWGGLVIAQDTGGTTGGGTGGTSGSAGAAGSGTNAGTTGTTGTKSGSKAARTIFGNPSDTTAPDSTTQGGAPAPKTGGSVDPFIPTTPKPDKTGGTNGQGASSAFGTPGQNTTGAGTRPDGTKLPGTDTTETGPSGPSSTFGPNDTTATQQAAPPSFTLPGFFGAPASTYTAGQGRLARPRFRYKVTAAQGYDDNVLQTPDDPQRAPDQRVLVDAGTPDTVTFVPVTTTTYEQAFAGPIVYFRPVTTTTFQRVVTPGRAPVFRTIRSPEPQKRSGSAVSRLGLQFDAQQATRRSLFTLDFNGSVDHVWSRSGTSGKDDYSGTLALAYLYNFTPRLQASVTTNIAYISQPDFTRLNAPERLGLGGGDIVNGLARLNVMYRLTPRFSTTLSVGQNAVLNVNNPSSSGVGASANGDNFETTFSMEARYLWKPRYTLIAELRHVLINYLDTPALNAKTELLLLGGELKLSSRLSATLRLGESVRIFDETGETSSAPYGEASLAYRIGPTSSVQWNSRFGYEEPQSASSETLSYRTTLNYFKNFTPRLSLSAGITGVSRNTTSPNASDISDQTIDANIGLIYHLTRQLTLDATFSFTKIVTTTGDRDYDRSRIFIGGQYEF